MPINELIHYCEDRYNQNGKCQTCIYECNNKCNICLQGIHNDQANLRQYDCINMTNCYVCSYINKYASEIYYTFQALVNHSITKRTEFNILSIGCGDCADLFGITEFLRINERNLPIKYTGVDINQKWETIHQKIATIFPNISFTFEYKDVFDYVDSLDIVPFNIVILEYVLNEIRKYTPDIIDNFINKLAHNIIERLPTNSLIIINDINHRMVRDYYPTLKKESEKSGNNISTFALRFTHPTNVPSCGCATLPNDCLVFNTNANPRFVEKSPCSSSIYILIKQ